TALLVQQFLAKHNTVVMPQPPYSPDMAPSDFFLFPSSSKGHSKDNVFFNNRRRRNRRSSSSSIHKEASHQCFSNWKLRWHQCTIPQGDYFEG
ncbi:hypothetical protein EAI_01261, partial [Harpegnathos saltator]